MAKRVMKRSEKAERPFPPVAGFRMIFSNSVWTSLKLEMEKGERGEVGGEHAQ
jgi:hypothetical protein